MINFLLHDIVEQAKQIPSAKNTRIVMAWEGP